jgi:glycosyltransferase involved in cell wall biosynthesis
MPDIYRAMDVFVLASLFEMMPIALLEALASGVPAIVNRHPVLEWMVGTSGEQESCGGESIDMSQPGRLRNFLNTVTSDWVAARGAGARKQAEKVFAKSTVIRKYIEYYRRVMHPGVHE